MKFCIILSVFLITSNSVSAQYGFRIGGGAADIIFLTAGQSPYIGYENNSLVHNLPLLSGQTGLFRQIEWSDRCSGTIGLLYSLQGIDYSTSFLHDDITFRLKISYLKIPLLVKIKTKLKQSKCSGVIFGPYISTVLNASKTTRIQGVKTNSPVGNVNRFDPGGIIGYSWDIGKNPGRLFVDFRCSYSLLNMMEKVDETSKYYAPDKEYARNMSMIIAFEYLL